MMYCAECGYKTQRSSFPFIYEALHAWLADQHVRETGHAMLGPVTTV